MEDRPYYDLISNVSFDMTRVIRGFARGAATGRGPAAPTVYLAEVTDDLDEHSEAVRRYFVQAGVRVLPSAPYPRDPEAFRRAARSVLDASLLYVQLLSEVPGKRGPGLPTGYAGLQAELARDENAGSASPRLRLLPHHCRPTVTASSCC